MDSAYSILRSPILTMAGPICVAIFIIFFWLRAGSIYSVLERVWRLSAGKEKIVDAKLNEFIQENYDLEKFRFLYGIRIDTKPELYRFFEWVKVNSIGVGLAKRANKWINIKSSEIITAPKRKDCYWVAGLMLVASLLLMACLQLASYKYAILQLKESKVWFVSDAKFAKDIFGDWVIEKAQCSAELKSLSEQTGANSSELGVICESLGNEDFEHFVKKAIEGQKTIGQIWSFLVFWWMLWGLFQANSISAAKRIIEQIERKAIYQS